MKRIYLIAPALGLLVAACSYPPAASPQLKAARAEYQHAAQGPARDNAPDALHVAKKSLDRAQEANDVSDDRAIDFAELARSRAALADRQGGVVVATMDLDNARKDLVVAQADQLTAVSRRLGAAEMQGTQGKVAIISTGLLFKTNSADLESGVKEKLDKVSEILAADPQVNTILIEGYTDDTGTPEINNPLSEKRADSVASYLESRGISRDRIATRGLATENPVASNQTVEGRAMNRRVEIQINPASTPPPPKAPTMEQPK